VLPLVQEALLNARRHAQAQRIAVVLERQENQVKIAVEDDGSGFDVDALPGENGNHFGLSIMRARAARIEGWLQVDSTPGQGTRVSLIWPLDVAPSGTQAGSMRQVSLPQMALFQGAQE
jgi:signal transduction histidine kinase